MAGVSYLCPLAQLQMRYRHEHGPRVGTSRASRGALTSAPGSAPTDVSAETSRRIACDSSVLGIREDENGEPLSIGRKTRSIPPAIGEDDINEWLDRNFFEGGTEPEFCNSQWYAGERMDWHLAVGNLFG